MRTIAFFSYARHDDRACNGLLSKIRTKLEIEVQAHAGEDDLEVFQDTADIEPGQDWRERLRDAIDNSAYFIPVLTPSYFNRPRCRQELKTWLTNYKSAGERRRIIPIRFLPLRNDPDAKPDALRQSIEALQCLDWSAFRNNLSLRGKLSQEISDLAALMISRST